MPTRGRGRDPGGTGLGLPIAQWIAEQHGGHLTLSSQLGQGTTAIVYLPQPATDATSRPAAALDEAYC